MNSKWTLCSFLIPAPWSYAFLLFFPVSLCSSSFWLYSLSGAWPAYYSPFSHETHTHYTLAFWPSLKYASSHLHLSVLHQTPETSLWEKFDECLLTQTSHHQRILNLLLAPLVAFLGGLDVFQIGAAIMQNTSKLSGKVVNDNKDFDA